VAVFVLHVEDRPARATRDSLLDIGDVFFGQARHAPEGEPPERDRDAQVHDALAVLADLDAGPPGWFARRRLGGAVEAGGHAGGESSAGAGSGARSGARLATAGIECVEDRRRLLGGGAALGDELQHGLEGIAHADASSSFASWSVASATVMSPR